MKQYLEYFKKKIVVIGEGILVMFSPTFFFIFVIGFLVVADLITGVMCAKKANEEITSDKMRNTTRKGLGYMLAIIVAYIIQLAFAPELEVMKIVAGAIAFVELKSIDENYEKLYGFSIFKFILTKFSKDGTKNKS